MFIDAWLNRIVDALFFGEVKICKQVSNLVHCDFSALEPRALPIVIAALVERIVFDIRLLVNMALFFILFNQRDILDCSQRVRATNAPARPSTARAPSMSASPSRAAKRTTTATTPNART